MKGAAGSVALTSFGAPFGAQQAFAANLDLDAKRGYAIDRSEPFRGGTTVHMSKRIDPPLAPAGATTRADASA